MPPGVRTYQPAGLNVSDEAKVQSIIYTEICAFRVVKKASFDSHSNLAKKKSRPTSDLPANSIVVCIISTTMMR